MTHNAVGILKADGEHLHRITVYKNDNGGYYVFKRKSSPHGSHRTITPISITANTRYILVGKTIYMVDLTFPGEEHLDAQADWDPFFPK